jgi:hypothetical protein
VNRSSVAAFEAVLNALGGRSVRPFSLMEGGLVATTRERTDPRRAADRAKGKIFCTERRIRVTIPRVRDCLMIKRRSTAHRLLFSLIACVLLCTIATSEIPELLTLRNDTSNDFTLRNPASAEGARVLSIVQQSAIQVVPQIEDFHTAPTIAVQDILPTDIPLFILNSILRT